MVPSSSTSDGVPVHCEICGTSSIVDVSRPPGDSVCPSCGTLLWVHAMAELTSRNSFVPDLRLSQLKATNRDDAIRELTQAIAEGLDWTSDQHASVCHDILAREELCSTGIGNGVALPHALVDWTDRSFTAMTLAPDGIPFNALDGQPVYLIIMIVSPSSRPEEHLSHLERISRSLSGVGPSIV